jgi:hypothetical protein
MSLVSQSKKKITGFISFLIIYYKIKGMTLAIIGNPSFPRVIFFMDFEN